MTARRAAFSAWAAMLCLGAPAFSQSPDRLAPRPSDRALPAPELRQEDRDDFVIRGPELEAGPVPDAGPGFLLRRVRFIGVTALLEKALAEIVGPYLNRRVDGGDLAAIRLAATRAYIDRGYVTSGVVLPNQDVADGVVVYHAIEGELGEILVSGADRLDEGYVSNRLRRGLETPLSVQALRENVLVLLKDPAIETLELNLRPSGAPGRATLEVHLVEAPPLTLSATVANDVSPSIGGETVEAEALYRSLAFAGDAFIVSGRFAEGLVGGGVSYYTPLNAHGLRLALGADFSDAEVVEAPTNVLDIESSNVSFRLGMTQALIDASTRSLDAHAAFEWTESKTRLLGRGFPFAPGAESDGASTTAAARFSLDFLDRGAVSAFAARTTLSLGVDAFGATENPGDLPDGEFFAWLTQGEYVRRLSDDDLTLSLQGRAQLTPDRLLPIEQFAVGGLGSVRGYRQNRFVRDNGFAASLELRTPIAALPIQGLSETAADGVIEAVGFFDAGGAWNTGVANRRYLASVGVGLRWRISPLAIAEAYFGQPLIDQTGPDEDDLQDFGLHFRLRIGFD